MTDESTDAGTVSAAIEAVDAASPGASASPDAPKRDPLAVFLVRAAAALEESQKFHERAAAALERIADRLDTILMADGTDASGRVIDATAGDGSDGVDGDLLDQMAAEGGDAVEPR